MGCPLRCPRGKGALSPLSLGGVLISTYLPTNKVVLGGALCPHGDSHAPWDPCERCHPQPPSLLGWAGAGGVVWGRGVGPPISTRSPVLSFSLFSTAAAQPCRARASLSRCMAPPGGYPASPRLLQSSSPRGGPWCPPSSFPLPVLLGGMGVLRGWGTSCCQAPPVLQGCPPPGVLCPGVAAGGCWGRRRRGPWGSVPGAHL